VHVFLHGFLGTSADWQPVIEELRLPSLALDLPGHGTAPFTPHFNELLYAATSHLPPFHLVGYSMGGRLALQFARAHPEKIASLTLLSTHLGLPNESARKERLQQDVLLAKRILETSVDEFLKQWYDQPLFRTLVSKMDIVSMRKKQDRAALAEAVYAFSLGHQPDFSSTSASLLVGEYDEIYQRHYAGKNPIIIPNAGHAAHLENPTAVANELLKGLSL
jgi:2-succinyl-6-hydroxy-2,4-cyclohexadiene-1-carboxylate synthase